MSITDGQMSRLNLMLDTLRRRGYEVKADSDPNNVGGLIANGVKISENLVRTGWQVKDIIIGKIEAGK